MHTEPPPAIPPTEGHRLIVENSEPAAWNHRNHIPTEKAEIVIRAEGWIGHQARLVTVGKDRVRSKIGSETRIITGYWERGYLVNPREGSHQAFIEATNETRRVRGTRPVPQGRLFHRVQDFAAAGELGHVIEATPQFLFRAGAAREHSHGHRANRR